MDVKKILLPSALCLLLLGLAPQGLAADNTQTGTWKPWKPKTVIPMDSIFQKTQDRLKAEAEKKQKLRYYDPKRDAAPKEPLAVKETNFRFSERLLVRPKTDEIVVHHVGIPDGDTSAAAIHRAHLANGWAGIGYHYVIRKDGTIERGRPLATVGAHAQGANYHTVGINVTGNFEREIPTKNQIKSLEDLLTWLCQTYKIKPGNKTIVGHRNVNNTECPGRNLYSLLPQIRYDVTKALSEAEPAAKEEQGKETK